MFPRGTRGPSGLIELNLRTNTAVSSTVFGADAFLVNPRTGEPGLIQQARGLAVGHDSVFVALFNSVVEFTLHHGPDGLTAIPRFRYQHPSACDLHGLAFDGTHLAAASTGTDAVLLWRQGSRWPEQLIPLGLRSAVQQQLNFPENQRGHRPDRSWRDAVSNTVHLNDVKFTRDGDLLVTSLTTLQRVRPDGTPFVVLHDPGANFHDCVVAGTRVFMTDGARGEIVEVDYRTGRLIGRTGLVDPAVWFLRGIVRNRNVVVAGASERVINTQLTLDLQPSLVEGLPGGGAFALVRLDRRTGHVSEPTRIPFAQFNPGSVVYALHRIPSSVFTHLDPTREGRSSWSDRAAG